MLFQKTCLTKLYTIRKKLSVTLGILLPSLLALLIIALSTMTLNRPLNCVMAILHL